MSYSTADAEWRDRFLKHMRTMLSEKQLFVDKQSLRDGADWKSQLLDYVETHKRLKITVHDIEACRLAFVAEVIATSVHEGNAKARSYGDAWNAALKL